jgi:hypothetical protein
MSGCLEREAVKNSTARLKFRRAVALWGGGVESECYFKTIIDLVLVKLPAFIL